MKLFLLLKLLLNIVAGFTLEWGYHTHMSHWSPSQQSGWVYFGGLETTSVVRFLFKAAIGTLAECLMVCFQRKKELVISLENAFIILGMQMYMYEYLYILKAIEIL